MGMKSLKRSSTIVLQIVVVALGLAALAFMLWEPTIEGRNVGATLSQIYLGDPFLAWAYIGSVAFFVALYQAFKLLGYIGQNKIFSPNSVKTLRAIKYCAIIIIVCFTIPAEAYLFIVRPGDDIAGGVFMGILISFISVVVATVADVFEGILQNVLLEGIVGQAFSYIKHKQNISPEFHSASEANKYLTSL